MSEVKALEQQLEDAKQLAEYAKMALKLERNPEFKKIILEKFCVEECARYARESASPMLTAEQRQDALNIAQAAGHLKRFLSVLTQMGLSAQDQLEEIEENIVNAQAEEDAELAAAQEELFKDGADV